MVTFTKKVRLLFWAMILFSIPTVSFGQIIGSPGKAGDFEIDANFLANNYTPAPGKDWRSVLRPDPDHTGFVLPRFSNIAGENAVWIIDGNSGSGSTRSELEVFRGTSNKNGNYIKTGQSPYAIETQSPSAPQKNDLTNIYVRAKSIPVGSVNHRWIMMGAETRSVDGTSYLDFEYNQAGISQTTTQLIGLGPDGGRTARDGTDPGDLLFVVDFSKGGNLPIPRIFEWQSIPGKGGKPATFTWVELDLGDFPNSVFIVTNETDIETAGYMSGFTGDGTPTDVTQALQFVEIVVDLTALGVAPSDPCVPNSTMLVKTRTSSSYTSELKDFNLFSFTIDNPGTPVPAAAVYCQGDVALPLSATLGAGGTTLNWYQRDPTTGNYTPLASAPTPSTAAAGTFSNLYYVSQSSADGCEGPKVAVPFTINAKPARPVVTITEATLCGTLTAPKLTVNCPIAGTYTLKQTGQADRTFVYPTDGNTVEFLNLVIAGSFSIKVTDANGCVSDATDCTNYTTNSCPVAPLTFNKVDNSQPASQQLFIAPAEADKLVEPSTKVTAAPNPYNDRVRFSLESKVSGQGSLELYNMMGQKVKTVYQGFIEKGKRQTIEYSVPEAQRANLIYIFRIGDQRTSGKLIGPK